jgi:hypothetical protein
VTTDTPTCLPRGKGVSGRSSRRLRKDHARQERSPVGEQQRGASEFGRRGPAAQRNLGVEEAADLRVPDAGPRQSRCAACWPRACASPARRPAQGER